MCVERLPDGTGASHPMAVGTGFIVGWDALASDVPNPPVRVKCEERVERF